MIEALNEKNEVIPTKLGIIESLEQKTLVLTKRKRHVN